jgi:hypothetical protein
MWQNRGSAVSTAATSFAAELLKVLQTATPTCTDCKFIKTVISKLISRHVIYTRCITLK